MGGGGTLRWALRHEADGAALTRPTGSAADAPRRRPRPTWADAEEAARRATALDLRRSAETRFQTTTSSAPSAKPTSPRAGISADSTDDRLGHGPAPTASLSS